MEFEIMADGFLMPEGPVAIPDGSVIFVEVWGRRLTRVWGDGRSEVVAELEGGPNGAALGPDGAMYVANNGGMAFERGPDGEMVFHGAAPDHNGGWIERVDLSTGKAERIYESCGGHRLSSPNDLVFDRSGNLWFTDIGVHGARTRGISGFYYATPDGSRIEEAFFGGAAFNGIGLSPDETKLYVADSVTARLWEYDLEGPGLVRQLPDYPNPGRVLCTLPGDGGLDSLAVTEAGNICVGTLAMGRETPGGITTFRPDRSVALTEMPDPFVTNICFGGADRRTAYMTFSQRGAIAKTRWPEAGLALNFCTY